MKRHLTRELDRLKQRILAISAIVEENVQRAVLAIQRHDTALARRVIESDTQIDLMEVDMEEECLKTLALYQPVAFELRFIVAILKINNDLERIGDLSVNIAERTSLLPYNEHFADFFDFTGMSKRVQSMLKRSLDALVNIDPSIAKEVCACDDEIDEMNRRTFGRIKQALRDNPAKIDTYIHLLSISRHLERIADLTTNIAEDVIYMAEGEIVRHRTQDYNLKS